MVNTKKFKIHVQNSIMKKINKINQKLQKEISDIQTQTLMKSKTNYLTYEYNDNLLLLLGWDLY